jgi:hypothetical protein
VGTVASRRTALRIGSELDSLVELRDWTARELSRQPTDRKRLPYLAACAKIDSFRRVLRLELAEALQSGPAPVLVLGGREPGLYVDGRRIYSGRSRHRAP